MAPDAPSLMGSEAPIQEEGGEDAAKMAVASRTNSEAHRPFLEISEEEPNLL